MKRTARRRLVAGPSIRPAACLLAAQYFSKVNYIIDSVKMHGVYPPPAPKLCGSQPPRVLRPLRPPARPASTRSSWERPPDTFWLAGHTGLVFHTGAQAAAAASFREGGEYSRAIGS